MPKLVSEISQGVTYEFSSEADSITASTPRIFRILKNDPTEYINLFEVCNVRIGDAHPRESGLYCYNVSAAFEGESRMAILATFTYKTTPSSGGQEDPKQYEPDVRPANWYTSTSLVEVPAQSWVQVGSTPDTLYTPSPICNPVGDLYESVTKVEAIVSIHVEQWEENDPTKHNLWAGCTNNSERTIGSMVIPRRCLMFRGVQSKPALEKWGTRTYRGWHCTYEFLYKRNKQKYHWTAGDTVNETEGEIGWDVLQPVSGFNVHAFNPVGASADRDIYGQPLKWDKDGKIVNNPFALPDDPAISVGDKVRAHVKVGIKDGKTGQRPSAQPIALNMDGTPRKDTATPKVIVLRYKVTEEMDFNKFAMRLE